MRNGELRSWSSLAIALCLVGLVSILLLSSPVRDVEAWGQGDEEGRGCGSSIGLVRCCQRTIYGSGETGLGFTFRRLTAESWLSDWPSSSPK